MAELQPGELDPSQQTIVAVVGSKGTGKSKRLRHYAITYPYDQLHIDLHGVDRPPEVGVKDSGVVEISEVPPKWPEHLRVEGKPLILYYQPDSGSPTLLEDMDAAMGLAYAHQRCLVLVHEWGELAKVGQTPPMTRRTLSQGRGRRVTLLLAMHRPYRIDLMTWTQADVVIVMADGIPKPRDRQEVADNIGVAQPVFEATYEALVPFGYMQYDRRQARPDPGSDQPDKRLLRYPPLTEEELRAVMRPASTSEGRW